MSSVVWYETALLLVEDTGRGQGFLGPQDPHRLSQGGRQPLLFCTMLLERPTSDDGVALSQELPRLGHKARVARHKALVWVVVRHEEWRAVVLGNVRREVGLGLCCQGLEGQGVVGWLGPEGSLGVALRLGERPHLLIQCFQSLLVLLKVGDGTVTGLCVAMPKLMETLWNMS